MRNHESTEEVPHHIKWSYKDRSDVMVECDSDGHHSEEGEVQQGEIHKVQVPTKLQIAPLERGHDVEYRAVNDRLYENVRELNDNLPKII